MEFVELWELPGIFRLNLHVKNLHGIDVETLSKYVILLYSEDSVLNNKRNLLPLSERKLKAMKMLGVNIYDSENRIREGIEEDIFFLQNPHLFKAVFDFLVFQNNFAWTEICVMEQEILENQRLRMRPVVASEDKDIILAAERKDKLKEGVHKRIEELDAFYEKFFKDFDEVRKEFKKHKAIEDSAKSLQSFF